MSPRLFWALRLPIGWDGRLRSASVAWMQASSNVSCRELGRLGVATALVLVWREMQLGWMDGWGAGLFSNGSQNWPASLGRTRIRAGGTQRLGSRMN